MRDKKKTLDKDNGKIKLNKIAKKQKLQERGITLIALVVTIIILLILAGVTLNIALSDNGLFSKTKKATQDYKEEQVNEEEYLNTITDKIEDINLGLNIKVKINGTIKKLTKDNFGEYLGMEVTNFKDVDGETEEVEVENAKGNDDTNKVTVSTKYRLYYIDFDNKYKDGNGTIYLKADNTNNMYRLMSDSSDNGKIKQLNPCLYESGKKAPTTGSMGAVRWLLNDNNWSKLKNTVKEEVKDKVNYIVGAPSLELMMDSYNTHYGLIGDTPENEGGDESGNIRKKLFYKFESGANGYQVGPGVDSNWGFYTAEYTVQEDERIGKTYFPGTDCSYWIASPATDHSGGNFLDSVFFMENKNLNACIHRCHFDGVKSLTPLVSLDSSFELELK